jgi:ABC-type transporter MlaC component
MMIVLFAAQPQAAVSCPVASFVQSAGNAYDSAARNGSPAAFASAAGRYTDLRALSFFALGRYRKDLPKSREAEYLALTRKFIGEFMQDYGKGFRASELTITGCKVSGSSYVVNGKLSTGGSVIFRVSKSGRRTITDINMKGIWLAQQLRSTFVGTISRTGSIDGLFKYLKS